MAVEYRNLTLKGTNVRFNNMIKTRLTHLFFSLMGTLYRPLAEFWVKKLFFTPPRYHLSDGEQQMIHMATPFAFQVRDQKIRGYRWGKGPAIIFIHGWGGSGVQFSPYFKPLTEAGFSVFTFDHPGHGGSDGRTSSYFEFSDAVEQFMVHHETLDIHAIVAHSLGGSAVINYLWKTQKNIKTILFAPALSLIETLDQTFSRYGVPSELFYALIEKLEKKTGHRFERENPVHLMLRLSSDILIVHDTEDKAIPYEESWSASLRQENIRLFPTKGLGHIRILKDETLAGQMMEKITG